MPEKRFATLCLGTLIGLLAIAVVIAWGNAVSGADRQLTFKFIDEPATVAAAAPEGLSFRFLGAPPVWASLPELLQQQHEQIRRAGSDLQAAVERDRREVAELREHIYRLEIAVEQEREACAASKSKSVPTVVVLVTQGCAPCENTKKNGHRYPFKFEYTERLEAMPKEVQEAIAARRIGYPTFWWVTPSGVHHYHCGTLDEFQAKYTASLNK